MNRNKTIKILIISIVFIAFNIFYFGEFISHIEAKKVLSSYTNENSLINQNILSENIKVSNNNKSEINNESIVSKSNEVDNQNETSIIEETKNIIYANQNEIIEEDINIELGNYISFDNALYKVASDSQIQNKEDIITFLKMIVSDDIKNAKIYEHQEVYIKNMYQLIVNYVNRTFKNYNNNSGYQQEILNMLDNLDFCFFGDSQVTVMNAYTKSFIPEEHFGMFPAMTILNQYNELDNKLNENIKNIAYFNGLNIGIYRNEQEYINAYERLFDKIKSYNGNINIYVTSLLPAKLEIVQKHIMENNTRFQFHMAPVYDLAIQNYCNNVNDKVKYINTNWMVSDWLYDRDGVHFKPEFYWTYIPYVLNYVMLDNTINGGFSEENLQ